MSIKPIETIFKGCRFRSRLEARWAVFFDALGIEWQYEPEGFEVPFQDGPIRYLPDFYLPGLGLWVEVKGSEDQFKKDAARISWMVDFGHLPGVSDGGGLLILGDIPDTTGPSDPFCWVGHPVLWHEKGVRADLAVFLPGRIYWHRVEPAELACAPDLPRWVKPIAYRVEGMHQAERTQKDNQEHRRAYYLARSARFEHGERG